MTQTVSSQELQALIDGGKPLFIDFFATWCGPCHALAPSIDTIAQENPELQVVKLDIDAEPEMAAHFKIRSIPTLVMMKDQAVTQARVGGATLGDLRKWVPSGM